MYIYIYIHIYIYMYVHIHVVRFGVVQNVAKSISLKYVNDVI